MSWVFQVVGLLWLVLVPGVCLGSRPASTHTFTIATANLSDNVSQSYEEAGIRILQALNPDVIAIQEFNYKLGTSQDLVRRIGLDYSFCREKGGARLPNGILSRYPIVAHGQWEDPFVANRDFAWATLALPGGHRLHVVSVHLVQNRANRRADEARHLAGLIRKSFPTKDYVVLCGDFNVTSRDTDAIRELRRVLEDGHVPVDQLDNPNTNAGRSRPYDFVLPNAALEACHVPTVLGGRRFADGLVFDTRLWNPPPAPADWEDSAADLQHMPVMKTFRIPVR